MIAPRSPQGSAPTAPTSKGRGRFRNLGHLTVFRVGIVKPDTFVFIKDFNIFAMYNLPYPYPIPSTCNFANVGIKKHNMCACLLCISVISVLFCYSALQYCEQIFLFHLSLFLLVTIAQWADCTVSWFCI